MSRARSTEAGLSLLARREAQSPSKDPGLGLELDEIIANTSTNL